MPKYIANESFIITAASNRYRRLTGVVLQDPGAVSITKGAVVTAVKIDCTPAETLYRHLTQEIDLTRKQVTFSAHTDVALRVHVMNDIPGSWETFVTHQDHYVIRYGAIVTVLDSKTFETLFEEVPATHKIELELTMKNLEEIRAAISSVWCNPRGEYFPGDLQTKLAEAVKNL